MLLKWLTHLTASLFVASLLGLLVTVVLGQTLMNSHYMEGQLDNINAYSRLSTALSNEAISEIGTTGGPQLTSAVNSVVTPDTLKHTINATINELTQYYQGNGTAPNIDFGNITSQLQSAGVQLPANSDLAKPIPVTPDSGTNKTLSYPIKNFASTRTAATITTAVLALVLLFLSWRIPRYSALPNAVITVAIFLGLLAIVCRLSVDVLNHFVRFSASSNSIVLIGQDLGRNIANDLARRYGELAVACFVVGVLTRFVAAWLQPKPSKPVPASAARA